MKVLYRPMSLLFGVLGGMLATTAFKQVWQRVAGEDEAPDPTSSDHSTGQVLLAATLQGALFGFVRAAVDRAGVKGYRKMTGRNLDDD